MITLFIMFYVKNVSQPDVGTPGGGWNWGVGWGETDQTEPDLGERPEAAAVSAYGPEGVHKGLSVCVCV